MVKVRKDLTGQQFERLTVVKQSENDYVKPDGRHEAKWLCKCNCNDNMYIEVTGYALKSGHTKSCGCLQKETMVKNGLNTNNLIHNTKKYNQYDLLGEYGIGYTSKGEEFYFDLEDYDKIKDYCWYIDNNGYVACTEKIFMHRLIMSATDDELVDHIKHKKYDNRKSELRLATFSQNSINRRKQSNNTSGITGVSYHKASKKWFAYIKLNGKQKRLYANSKDEAIVFRKELEDKYFKEYSYSNSMIDKENNNEDI